MKVSEILVEAPRHVPIVKNVPAPGKHEFFVNAFEIARWLDKLGIKNYTINTDFTVDVKGNVDIGYATNLHGSDKFTHIPVQFGEVTGSFSVADSPDLFSLKGSPKTVGGKFSCSGCRILTSLEGGPEYVGKLYNARACALTSLKGAAKHIDGNFNVFSNKITSLEGGPEYVAGDFAIYYNLLTSLKHSPKTVKGRYIAKNNKLTSLDGISEDIGGDIEVSHNKITSLQNIHKIIKKMNGDFWFGNNPLKSNVLGVFLINGCKTKHFNAGADAPKELQRLARIVSSHKNDGRDEITDIQGDMVEADLNDFAEL